MKFVLKFAFILIGFLFNISSFGQVAGVNSTANNKDLKGLQRVCVEVYPESASQKFLQQINLELRKAGLRIVKNKSELDPSDGLIIITIKKPDQGNHRDFLVEWSLLQKATLSRTKESIPVITWRHLDDRRNVDAERVAEPMVKNATDLFLNAWLSANDR